MEHPQIAYRGFTITPMAAFDGGLYAAMMIICDPNGTQRASGILGHFPSASEALDFALMAAKDEVNRRAWHSSAAA